VGAVREPEQARHQLRAAGRPSRRVRVVIDIEVQCGAKLADCWCGEQPDHAPPHKCHGRSEINLDGECHGEWNGDGSDTPANEIVTYPDGSKSKAETMARLAELRGDDLLLDLMPRTVRRGGIRFDAPALGIDWNRP
jgi:hypothetical protein